MCVQNGLKCTVCQGHFHSNVIFFSSREKVKLMLPPEWTERGKWTSYLADFLSGALTGAVISTIFYPVNVAKTHMQLVIGGPYSSFWIVFKDLIQKRGLRGMFAGVHSKCLHC